jgi:hypothetical protein
MLPFLRNRKWLAPWLLSALAETAVAIPWVIFLYSISGEPRWPEALPGAWLLLLAYLTAGLWEAGAPSEQDPKAAGKRRLGALVVEMAGIYLAAYFALPAGLRPGSPVSDNLALSMLPVAGYLWYQGARGAVHGITYSRAFERFTSQCVAVAVAVGVLVWSGAARDSRVQVLLAWSVPLLFAAGLTLLVVTREQDLRSNQARIGEQGTGTGAGSRLATGMVAGLLGLTLAASSLLSVDRLMRFMGLLDRPLSWLTDLFLLIFYRWTILLWAVIGPVLQWLMKRKRPPQQQEPQAMDQGPLQELLKQYREGQAPFDPTPYIKLAVLIGLLAALAIWLYRLGRRVPRQRSEEEEHISLGFWASLLADLKGLLGLLRRRPATAGPGAEGGGAESPIHPRDPRALYRRLQAWGASLGRPRLAAETPAHYQAALAGCRPEAAPAVAAVTAAYNQARYGPEPPAPEMVTQAAAAVSELQQLRQGQ